MNKHNRYKLFWHIPLIIQLLSLIVIVFMSGCGEKKLITIEKCFDEERGLPRPDRVYPDKFKLVTDDEFHKQGMYVFELPYKWEEPYKVEHYPALNDYLILLKEIGYTAESAQEFEHINLFAKAYLIDTKDNEIKAFLFFDSSENSNVQMGFVFTGVNEMNDLRKQRLEKERKGK